MCFLSMFHNLIFGMNYNSIYFVKIIKFLILNYMINKIIYKIETINGNKTKLI